MWSGRRQKIFVMWGSLLLESCLLVRKLANWELQGIQWSWWIPSCWPWQTKWKRHLMCRVLLVSLPFLAIWMVASLCDLLPSSERSRSGVSLGGWVVHDRSRRSKHTNPGEQFAILSAMAFCVRSVSDVGRWVMRTMLSRCFPFDKPWRL